MISLSSLEREEEITESTAADGLVPVPASRLPRVPHGVDVGHPPGPGDTRRVPVLQDLPGGVQEPQVSQLSTHFL